MQTNKTPSTSFRRDYWSEEPKLWCAQLSNFLFLTAHNIDYPMWAIKKREREKKIQFTEKNIYLHHKLMSTNNQRKTISTKKRFGNIIAKGMTSTTRTSSPANTIIRIRPQQVTHWAFLRNLQKGTVSNAVYRTNFTVSFKRRTKEDHFMKGANEQQKRAIHTSWLRFKSRIWSRVSNAGERPPWGQNIYRFINREGNPRIFVYAYVQHPYHGWYNEANEKRGKRCEKIYAQKRSKNVPHFPQRQ